MEVNIQTFVNGLYLTLSLSITLYPNTLTTQVYVPLFTQKTTHFVISFINQVTPNCEIVFANDLTNSSEIEHVAYISEKLISGNHAGVFNIDVKSTVNFKRFHDIHRMSVAGTCATVIIFLERFIENTPKTLFNLLTPPYKSICRKDEDYFFFLSRSTLVLENVLLSPEFGNKIKFKAGFSNLSFGNVVSIKTVDFYHTLSGPKVVAFSVNMGKNFDLKTLFPDFTRNFRGFPLKMAIPNAPFRIELEFRDGRYHPKRGTYKPWLDAAMAKLNFTYDCFFSSYGGGTGVQFKNGTWKGAVADVKDNVADLAVFIGHIYNRHQVVDWSAPLSHEWLVFVVHKPQFYYSPLAIFWPFEARLWLSFLMSILGIAVCFKLVAKWQFNVKRIQLEKNYWTLPRTLGYIFTTFLEQDREGPTKLPYHPVRILSAFWLIFALVTATAYRAKLVSVMAFPESSFVPTTYEELVDSNFGAGIHVIGKGGAALTIFQQGKGRVYEGIFARLEIIPSSPLDCLLRAIRQDFACLMWEGLNAYLNAKNISHGTKQMPMQVSVSKTSFINDGMIYERRAIIRKQLDDTILAAGATGLAKKWVDMDLSMVRKARFEWESSLNRSISDNIQGDDGSGGPSSLTFANCASSFYILWSGSLVSTIVFLGEKLVFKRRLIS